MKYFMHDTNAFMDDKITLLYIEFGFEAIGLFFTILEKIAMQEKPIPEIVLKKQLNIKKKLQKQLSFMYEIGILSLKNGEVFNENILKFSEKYQIKREKNRKKISEWRDNQKVTENVTSYEPVRNHCKDNIIKDNIINTNIKEKKEIENFSDEIENCFFECFLFFDKKLTERLSEKEQFNWKKTIKDLIQIDKLSCAEILEIVKFGTSDAFWSSNFLSITKLRKKNPEKIPYFMVFQQKIKAAAKNNKKGTPQINDNIMKNPNRLKFK